MAEAKRDYYEVLGVPKDADDAALKKAYREIAKKNHPDVKPGDKEAEKIFKEASEAYAVLSDPDKRRQYDQFGHAAFDGSGGAGFDFSSMDFSDIFGDIFGDFMGGLGGMFGGSSRRSRGYDSNAPRKGANVRTSVRITFEEAVSGAEKEIEVPFKEECRTCHGTGAKPGTSPKMCPRCQGSGQEVRTQQSFFGMVRNVSVCPECSGAGKVIQDKCPDCRGMGYKSVRKRISVSVPAGIDNGMSVRLREKGEPGENNGPRGDLLVEVSVGTSPKFARQDMDLFSTVSISMVQAALGCEIVVNTVDGDVVTSIRPGTQSGTRIRLRGKGVPDIRNASSRGDHYVTVVVDIPTKLSAEAKEALRAYDALSGDSLAKAAAAVEKKTAKSAEGGDGDDKEKHGKKKGFFDKFRDKDKNGTEE